MNENRFLETDEIEIDLAEMFRVLLRKWWLILMVALAGFIAAAGITKFAMTPEYQSQAMIYILTKTTSVTSMVDLQIGAAITGDFEIISTSKPVIDAAISECKKSKGVDLTRRQILGMITITNEKDTRILKIQAIHEDPALACVVANAVANATSDRMAQIMKSDRPTMVEWAEVEKEPVGPSTMKNSIIGFLLGAMFVCGILVVQFLMNDNIKTEEDVEKYLGVPTLVSIPVEKKKRGRGRD